MTRPSLIVGLFVAASFFGRSAVGDDDTGNHPRDVRSAFFVARSNNKNQVHYGVRVDAACRPVGADPIHAYWRMLESRGEIEPLLPMEAPAYGVRDVEEVQRDAASTRLRLKLRAFPERPVFVTVTKTDAGCDAVATTAINGAPSRLYFVYVKLKWPFGIDQLLLRGSSSLDGRRVEEWIRN